MGQAGCRIWLAGRLALPRRAKSTLTSFWALKDAFSIAVWPRHLIERTTDSVPGCPRAFKSDASQAVLAWIRGWRPKFSASARAGVPDETWRPDPAGRGPSERRKLHSPLPPRYMVPGWMFVLDLSVDVCGCDPSSKANANALFGRRVAPLDTYSVCFRSEYMQQRNAQNDPFPAE